MIEKTKNLTGLLRYLRDNAYRAVPPMLFDRYLWLYNDLEPLQHDTVYGSRADRKSIYHLSDHSGIKAIAVVQPKGRSLQVSADAVREDYMEQLIQHVLNEDKRRKLSLTLCNEHIATCIAQAYGRSVTPGAVKYFTSDSPKSSSLPVREMFAQDEAYLEAIQPRRWPVYRVFLQNGIRFFGLIVGGHLKAMCGLTQLTCFSSQVIGVETFDPADHCKGYAKAVCSHAIRESLSCSPIATWSTSQQNVASCRTAESLGMQPYYRLFEISHLNEPSYIGS
jgi:hypothetical protein